MYVNENFLNVFVLELRKFLQRIKKVLAKESSLYNYLSHV